MTTDMGQQSSAELSPLHDLRKATTGRDRESLSDAISQLEHPAAAARPTPFYWWSGADLDRERLTWQLDQLAAAGIGGTIVGYSHRPDGSVDAAEPTPFTPAWWDLFSWFVQASADRGMTVGFQDYNVLIDLLSEPFPELAGAAPGTLHEHSVTVHGPAVVRLDIAQDTVVTARLLAPNRATADQVTQPAQVVGVDGQLDCLVPTGAWTLTVVHRQPPTLRGTDVEFDALHPLAGRAVIERYYQPFVTHLGAAVGASFTTFFQDELDLGLRMPMWNDHVAHRLHDEFGFDPSLWLPALWHDVGPRTYEFRHAYKTALVTQLEDAYFRPIHDWHEQHGTALLMDQLSRGDLRQGRDHYADFLRTMSWYQGPGNDDPNLTAPRSVAAFKVSASIAHLHDRPLVVNEAFYGSGWGVTPADMLAGINHGLACGVTHLIVHGLYYTTEGGWWEWAAPDFHFRQPWFRDSRALWQYVTRACALLRLGQHVCDIAILDPTIDLDLTGGRTKSPELVRDLLETLVGRGHDADIVDADSLAVSEQDGAHVRIAHERYATVIVPAMSTISAGAATKLAELAASGITVVVLGEAPRWTERAPLPADHWFDCVLIPDSGDLDRLIDLLNAAPQRHFSTDAPGVLAIHRRLSNADLFLISNTTKHSTQATCRLAALVEVDLAVEEWDLWTGERTTINTDDSASVTICLEPGQARLLVATPSNPGTRTHVSSSTPDQLAFRGREIALDDEWELEVVPTLDNRHRDFDYRDAALGVPTWDIEVSQHGPSGPWVEATATYSTRLLVLGPVPPDRAASFDTALAALEHVAAGDESPVSGTGLRWRPYELSLQHGLSGDPVLRDWTTGPHGLKGAVPDDFLDLALVDPTSPPGSHYFFRTTLRGASPDHGVLAYGSRGPLKIWCSGRLLLETIDEQSPAFFPPFGIPDLRITPRRLATDLHDGDVLLIRTTRLAGQPSRAYVVAGAATLGTATPPPGRARWWAGPTRAMDFDPQTDARPTTWVRAATPPGATELTLTSTGEPRAIWIDGDRVDAAIRPDDDTNDGDQAYRIELDGLVPFGSQVVIELAELTDGSCGGAALTGPLTWHTGPTAGRGRPWPALGLTDYSGVLRYSRRLPASTLGARGGVLRLDGLQGSARVFCDDSEIGSVLAPPFQIELPPARPSHEPRLVIEVANTLANHYRHYPSPYAAMQPPGGGFDRATIRPI
ncbi:MAG: glycosyl hydrolase [Jatrophihabitans sp.]|uniref:glycosyl hydrolase n=1 Tax=Jatrophihabitans sp. TaxID=1932789 RepID=UPI003F7F31DC